MSLLRRPAVRIAALLLVVWIVIAVGFLAATDDVARSIEFGGIVVVINLGVLAALVFIAWVPPVLPRLVMLAVARRERFEVAGFPIGNRLLYRDLNRRWRISPAFGWSELTLTPRDEVDLAARLIRTWRVLPIVAGTTLLVGTVIGFRVEPLLQSTVIHGPAILLGLLLLFGNAIKLTEWLREDVRSPRSIALALRQGAEFGERELAYTVTNRYLYRDVRPREYTPAIMATIAEWLREEPTGHEYRYVLLRYLTDIDDLTGLAEQRAAILGLETHLRSDPTPQAASLVIWYAAHHSSSAEEAERIWGWLVTPDPGLDAAEKWLRARIAALRGDSATARSLAEEARAAYMEMRHPEWTFEFEIAQIDRLLASLPPASGVED